MKRNDPNQPLSFYIVIDDKKYYPADKIEPYIQHLKDRVIKAYFLGRDMLD